jgi:hypothetical protein
VKEGEDKRGKEMARTVGKTQRRRRRCEDKVIMCCLVKGSRTTRGAMIDEYGAMVG